MEELVDKPLSNFDILEKVDNMAKIELYPNLHKYHDIDELLGQYNACFILIQSEPNFGHWVLVHRLPNGHVEFFNSYGGYPDNELKNISKKYRDESNQNYTYLSKLLYDCPYDIDYNEYCFQKKKKNISTCGRWCIMRYFLNYVDLDDFADIFKNKYGDEAVTILTEWINN